MTGLLARLDDNVGSILRGLREMRKPPTAVTPLQIATVTVLGLGIAGLVGIAIDARAFAWSTTLSDGWYAFFGWITRYGKSDWMLIPLAGVVLAVAVADWRAVSRGEAAAWREIGLLAVAAFVTIALPGLLTDAIKPIVGRFRPGHVPVDAFAGAFAFMPFSLGGSAQYSFPSGHATTVGAAALLAVMLFGRWSAPIVFACGLVAFSRVVVGAHFPSDVIAGAVVGTGTAYLIVRGLAAAGIGFVERPNGAIRPRVAASLSAVSRYGPGYLLRSLGAALVSRRGAARQRSR